MKKREEIRYKLSINVLYPTAEAIAIEKALDIYIDYGRATDILILIH